MAINGSVTRGDNIRPGMHKYLAKTSEPSCSYLVQSDFGVERNALWIIVLFLCDTVVSERDNCKRGATGAKLYLTQRQAKSSFNSIQ